MTTTWRANGLNSKMIQLTTICRVFVPAISTVVFTTYSSSK